MYLGAFRALTPKGVPTRKLLPGAITGGICWTVLQVLGTYLVHHFLHSDSVYGVFGTVLGLLAWIALAVQVTVYCAEINVVLARRLWPRSIVQPPLTEADRASMALQALQNQRRPEQHIEVTFDDRRPGTEGPPGPRGHRTRLHRPREAQVPEPRTGTDEATAARQDVSETWRLVPERVRCEKSPRSLDRAAVSGFKFARVARIGITQERPHVRSPSPRSRSPRAPIR